MNQILCSKIPSDAFDFDVDTNTFSQEISMLEHGQHNPFRQIWADSSEEGFVLVSSKTNMELVFSFSGASRFRGGDVSKWELTPYSTDPVLSQLKVVIWNT